MGTGAAEVNPEQANPAAAERTLPLPGIEGGTQQAAPVTPPAPQQAPKSAKEAKLGDDDEIPTDAEILTMSRKGFNSRLDRETKRALKEKFGTSDFDAIQAKIKKAEDIEKEREEQRRAELSEIERVKEDNKRLRRERDDATERYRMREQIQAREQTQGKIAEIGNKLVHPKWMKVAMQEFADHLVEKYTEAELENFPEEKVEEWFKSYIAQTPEASAKAPEQPLEQQPLTNGLGANGRAPANPNPPETGAKSFSPNAKNPMTPEEARAKAREQGINWD